MKLLLQKNINFEIDIMTDSELVSRQKLVNGYIQDTIQFNIQGMKDANLLFDGKIWK